MKPISVLTGLALQGVVIGWSAPAPQNSLTPVAIYQVSGTNGGSSWVSEEPADPTLSRNEPRREVFRAIVSHTWPAGRVPVYAVESKGTTELRRRPPQGQENFLEPLFFALPSAHETNAAAIAGRWSVRATHADGHESGLRWDLTVEGEELAGRFDPDTDYRFAFIPGGTWRTNVLRLSVDYINDHFEIIGRRTNATLAGNWRRVDDADHGSWQADRDGNSGAIESTGLAIVTLNKISASPGRPGEYTTNGTGLSADGRRTGEAICQVWLRSEQEIPTQRGFSQRPPTNGP